MIILGIETSCDETAASLVKDGTKILSNVVASSAEMHAKSGGVIPEQAARQQVKSIIPVITESVKGSKGTTSIKSIDAIAVTVGPGLIGSLLVGVETAKTLAYIWKKPIIPVNHLAAHIYANWLEEKSKIKNQKLNIHIKDKKGVGSIPRFPAVALVVSGGHTDLVLMKDHATPATPTRSAGGRGKLKWLGGTRDDAAGEAFDKTARLLGLEYPGGPSISREAEKYFKGTVLSLRDKSARLKLFPRPMMEENNFDWSFSGLKTAVQRELTNPPAGEAGQPINKSTIPYLAAEIQEAITDILVFKTLKAVEKYKPEFLLLAGGVAANKSLREKFSDEIKLKKLQVFFHVPKAKFCTDNATYIASYAFFNPNFSDWRKIKALPELRIDDEV